MVGPSTAEPHAGSDEVRASLLTAFTELFGPGTRPRVFFAPGRVNLMGAHLDYNGGPVMPTAIDRGTFVAVRARADRRVRLRSTLQAGAFELDLDALPDPGEARVAGWQDYPTGVLLALRPNTERRAPGLDLLFGGNLPIGAGLSSSASICVVTALALDVLWELGTDVLERVRAALWAEREFVGVQCGIMDPHAVGLARPGHLLWLDCRDGSFEHLPLDPARVCIAVADTGVRRELASSAFNARVAECNEAFDALRDGAPGAECLRDVPLAVLEERAHRLTSNVAARARHVLEEVARTFDARDALKRGDLARFGRSMSRAHQSLREQFEVSVPELDCLAEAALEHPGVLGARLTGAGFGGCTVTLLEQDAREGFAEHMTRRYRDAFGREPVVEFFGGDPGPRELEA